MIDRTPFYRTSHELKHHFSNIQQTWTCSSILVIEHPIFSFERTNINIKHNRAFTWFTKLLIELTRTSTFLTSNELEHVHLCMPFWRNISQLRVFSLFHILALIINQFKGPQSRPFPGRQDLNFSEKWIFKIVKHRFLKNGYLDDGSFFFVRVKLRTFHTDTYIVGNTDSCYNI